MIKVMHGRPKTTGRFRTRREMLERIYFLWTSTSCNQAAIARNCRVSGTTVSKLIDKLGIEKDEDWRVLDQGDMMLYDENTVYPEIEEGKPFEPAAHLDAVSLRACGHGWTPGVSPLPVEVLRELDLLDYVNHVTLEENTLN